MTATRREAEGGSGIRRLPLFYPMIYSNEDLDQIIQRLLDGLRHVVHQGLRVIPACHTLSYTLSRHESAKVLGRKELDPIRNERDVEYIFRESRLFLLAGQARKIYTEASLVALDGPSDLLPLGSQMGPPGDYVVIYSAHIRRPSEVVYAPILRQAGRLPRLGTVSWLHDVPPQDFPNVIPIELYGTTAGEA